LLPLSGFKESFPPGRNNAPGRGRGRSSPAGAVSRDPRQSPYYNILTATGRKAASGGLFSRCRYPPAMSSIEFYFDFSSPYGYFAGTRIDELAARHGRSVNWRPFLVGTAMKTTGHRPMIDTPMINDYLTVDVPRFARLLNVPFQLPESFPVVASSASRAFYWLEEQDARLARRFAQSVYHAFFGEGRDISKVAELQRIADACGIDGALLREAAQDTRIKDLFREKNDAALDKGVFGSPFVLVDGEPFWGADRLDQVEKWLKTGGW
jgi:2-hydroxychromene-2-carboxylate isomerase